VSADVFLFWFLAIVTVAAALNTVLITNPIFSALSLAMTMLGVSAIFVTLSAYFLAGVQLIVYAGAVTVLFVMVLMLFDLKHELVSFSRGKISGVVKIGIVGLLGGLVIGTILMTLDDLLRGSSSSEAALTGDTTKELGKLLFTKYVFGFEALGALLLIVAIGSVALARSKGGTHAKQ
jgi:NADH-quinone oxidoreductase subunit J